MPANRLQSRLLAAFIDALALGRQSPDFHQRASSRGDIHFYAISPLMEQGLPDLDCPGD